MKRFAFIAQMAIRGAIHRMRCSKYCLLKLRKAALSLHKFAALVVQASQLVVQCPNRPQRGHNLRYKCLKYQFKKKTSTLLSFHTHGYLSSQIANYDCKILQELLYKHKVQCHEPKAIRTQDIQYVHHANDHTLVAKVYTRHL